MKINFKNSFQMFTVLLICVFLSIPAFAQDGTLLVQELHDKNGQAISGMTVSAYQVGTTDAYGQIRIAEDFSEIVTASSIQNLQTATAENVRELAQQLRVFARAEVITAYDTAETDAEGKARFGKTFPQGIYLIDYAELQYFASTPSLIAIPLITEDSSGAVLESYSIVLNAKVEDNTPTEPETTAPETTPETTEPETTSPGTTEETTSPSTTEESSTTETETTRYRRPTDDDDDGPDPTTSPAESETPGEVLGENRNPVAEAVGQVLGAVRDIATGDTSMEGIFLFLAATCTVGLFAWSILYMRSKEKKKRDME